MNDTELLAHCQVKSFQGSGPGGQHRNKTNTGVVLLFPLSSGNLEIRCCEDRSAHINRIHAVHRLRLKMALQWRVDPDTAIPFPGSNGNLNPTNAQFPQFVAQVLDRLEKAKGDLRPVSETWNLSPSALTRILSQDKTVWEALLQLRKRHSKGPLK